MPITPRIAQIISLVSLFAASSAMAEPVTIGVLPIAEFKVGSSQRRFGPFEFVGGLELYSRDNSLFGAWSSLRMLPGGKSFIGILDTGHWFTGALERDRQGRLSGLGDTEIEVMLDRSGQKAPGKSYMDAEGLALRGSSAFVGFEQRHRVDRYPLGETQTMQPDGTVVLPFPVLELRGNGGLETLVAAPADSPLKGALVAITEKSIDDEGNLYAGILDGPRRGAFSVQRHDGFDVTDGAFLPNGDLLLLQRRFTLASGVAMRLARVRGSEIRPGAVIDPEILLHAAGGYQIDNMEGLDIQRDADGSIRVIIVSDDNHSILQRSLMLEFRYNE